MSDTPEIDAKRKQACDINHAHWVVPYEDARSMERQRNEANQVAESYRKRRDELLTERDAIRLCLQNVKGWILANTKTSAHAILKTIDDALK